MRRAGGLRFKAAAVAAVVFSALTIAVLTPPAQAAQITQDGPVNYVGPAPCPGGTTDCHTTTPGENVDVVQTGTSNTVDCEQTATFDGPGSAATEITQICKASQTGGTNTYTANQTATLTTASLSALTTIDHDALQTVDVNQSNGANSVTVNQKVDDAASSNVNLPVTQLQDDKQIANIVQNSVSNNQSASVNQNFGTPSTAVDGISALAQAPQVVQKQNTVDPDNDCNATNNHPDPNQEINFHQQTVSGTNNSSLNQFQKLAEQGFGFGGTNTLQNLTQQEGVNCPPEQGEGGLAMNWEVESEQATTTLNTSQEKRWSQAGEINPTLGGSRSQVEYDETSKIGQLLSGMPSTYTGFQTATLVNEGLRRCWEHSHAFAQINATETQNCNGSTQTASGNLIDTTNDCTGTDGQALQCEDNPPTEVHETTGNEGISPGDLKNHPEIFGQVGLSPSQRVDSVFDQTNVRFPSLGSRTLLEALDFPGGNSLQGAAQTLIKHALVGYVCALHTKCDYKYFSFDIQFETNDSLAGPGGERDGSRSDMIALAKKYATENVKGWDPTT